MNVRDMLIREEGWYRKAYPDPLTHGAPYTIGVGHTGPEVREDTIWDDDTISSVLDADIAISRAACEDHFPWFNQLNEPRQAVLIGMAFQMGISGLLAFKQTLKFMENGDWAGAKYGMLSSLWARQTPKRAHRMADQMESGEWVT